MPYLKVTVFFFLEGSMVKKAKSMFIFVFKGLSVAKWVIKIILVMLQM